MTRRCHPLARPWAVSLAPVLLGVTSAHAVDDPAPATAPPPPDKSDFSLFDPTPAADLRSFSTDRPDKSTSPYTVDAGHLQYETDLVGSLYNSFSSSNTRTRQVFACDPVLKLGIVNNADVEIALGGYQNFSVLDRSTGATSNFDGFGDVTIRTKMNLLGNDGGSLAAAVVSYFKIPTAPRNIGNGVGEFGLTVPVQYTLPFNVTALAVAEVDDLKNAENTGRHAGFTNLINLSHSIISPKLIGAIELWSQMQAAHTPGEYTLDLSVAYLLGSNTQIDAASYVGLNKAAPDVVVYIGLSQRF